MESDEEGTVCEGGGSEAECGSECWGEGEECGEMGEGIGEVTGKAKEAEGNEEGNGEGELDHLDQLADLREVEGLDQQAQAQEEVGEAHQMV